LDKENDQSDLNYALLHSQANATNLTTNYGTSKRTQNDSGFQKIKQGNHPTRD